MNLEPLNHCEPLNLERAVPDEGVRRWAAATSIELAAVIIIAVVLSGLMTYPLAFRAGSVGRIYSGDGQLSIWNVAWVARILIVNPDHLYDAISPDEWLENVDARTGCKGIRCTCNGSRVGSWSSPEREVSCSPNFENRTVDDNPSRSVVTSWATTDRAPRRRPFASCWSRPSELSNFVSVVTDF